MNKKYTKVIGQIYETNDYEKFGKILGNRDLVTNLGLKKSLQESGQLVPIKVNKFYEIVDGQNRFNYLKELNLPVQYYISENYKKEHVPSINVSPKNWTIENFMNFHADNGVDAYVRLRDFYMQSNLNLRLIIAGGMGYKLGSTTKTLKLFRNEKGNKYKFFNEQKLRDFENFYNTFLKELAVDSDTKSQNALWTLYNQPNFDVKRMIKKAIARGVKEDLKNAKTEPYTLKVLFEAYQNMLDTNSRYYIKHKYNSNGDLIFK